MIGHLFAQPGLDRIEQVSIDDGGLLASQYLTRRFESFRALRKLRRENPTEAYVFVVVEARQGRRDAVCSPPAHAAPRLQLLANDGHDTRALQHYLGHKNIQHTVLLHRAFP